MNSEASRKTVLVSNAHGLHARPCLAIVNTIGRFQATVTVRKGDETADASSILGLMSLAAPQGTELGLLAEGPEAKEALEALVRLFANEFGIDYSD
jgi:phosphocarrier protein